MVEDKTADGLPMIGPHEGREFVLMDEGRKHVAYWSDYVPEEYADYKARPEYDVIEWDVPASLSSEQMERLRARGAHYEGLNDGSGVVKIPYRILYREGYADEARRLAEIVKGYGVGFKPELEREIGQILDYPAEAIEYFVARGVRRRDRME